MEAKRPSYAEKFKDITKNPWFQGGIVILIVIVAYSAAMDMYLVQDDYEWLESSYSGWQKPATLFKLINNFFRPVVKLSYLINYSLFGTQGIGYISTTVGFHILNVFLLFLLMLKIRGNTLFASLVALFWGIAPYHSEAVIYSAGSRPDCILLTFILLILLCYSGIYSRLNKMRFIGILIFTLLALATKETWILIPLLVFSFLWIVMEFKIYQSLKYSTILIAIFIIYIFAFIVIPMLSNQTAPSSYANAGILYGIKKFGFLVFHYFGIGEFASYSIAKGISSGIVLALMGLLFIKTKNRLALWGLIWMLITTSISLIIKFAPLRYNYLPLLGFWIMIIAFGNDLYLRLKENKIIKRGLMIGPVAVFLVYLLLISVIRLQLEISDYRFYGDLCRTVTKMYGSVQAKIPRHQPLIFINLGTRKGVHETADQVKGYDKIFFVRNKGPWQLILLAPFANFIGDPFKERLEPIPDKDLNVVLKKDFTLLIFNNSGFKIISENKKEIIDYYQRYQKLPPRTQAFEFRKI